MTFYAVRSGNCWYVIYQYVLRTWVLVHWVVLFVLSTSLWTLSSLLVRHVDIWMLDALWSASVVILFEEIYGKTICALPCLIHSVPRMLNFEPWVPRCMLLDDETTFMDGMVHDSTLRVIQWWRKATVRMLRRSFTWYDALVRVLLLRTEDSLPLSSPAYCAKNRVWFN